MTARDPLARIRELYFTATSATIQDAFDEAIDLIKAMGSEEERNRAAVYMEGLAEMRKEFRGRPRTRR